MTADSPRSATHTQGTGSAQEPPGLNLGSVSLFPASLTPGAAVPHCAWGAHRALSQRFAAFPRHTDTTSGAGRGAGRAAVGLRLSCAQLSSVLNRPPPGPGDTARAECGRHLLAAAGAGARSGRRLERNRGPPSSWTVRPMCAVIILSSLLSGCFREILPFAASLLVYLYFKSS